VIDKANGGKADALNTGLNFCRTPLFCAMDADSMLEREALVRLARAFIEDVRMVAAGGIIRIANGCLVQDGEVKEVRLPSNYLAGFQVMEYLRAFFVGRVGWEAMNSTLVISGAFGMFRRAAVVEVGGFDTTTVGEDMELVVRLHRLFRERGEEYRIGFIPDPVAWTEAPETLQQLGRQRDRWQRGLIETLTRHVRMLFNPSYGRIGALAYPYYFFFEMLGPILELMGYISFVFLIANGSISGPHIAAFLSLAVVFGLVLSISAVLLEEMTFRRYARKRDLLHLFRLAILENFGYRQLIFYWRFRGIISKFRKSAGWGEMKRKGFQTVKRGEAT
jgi:cellulose synthase/poly-beta-1,6-N-acetylglucosamine synthase-like glycosyltransferase